MFRGGGTDIGISGPREKVKLYIMSGYNQEEVVIIILQFSIIELIHLSNLEFSIPSITVTDHCYIISILVVN